MKSRWETEGFVSRYLDEVRAGIPHWGDQVETMLRVVDHFRPEPGLILDLGCGDGVLSRMLLDRYPRSRAVMVDGSRLMVARAREAAAGYGDRAVVRLGDLSAPILKYAREGSVGCAVSGYAIHHLANQRKRRLYREVYRLLSPGGVFVNVEYVSLASGELARLHEELFVESVAKSSGRPAGEVEREFHRKQAGPGDILAGLEEQLAWLRRIGYEHVDCYFKFMELAVFGGVRPSRKP